MVRVGGKKKGKVVTLKKSTGRGSRIWEEEEFGSQKGPNVGRGEP